MRVLCGLLQGAPHAWSGRGCPSSQRLVHVEGGGRQRCGRVKAQGMEGAEKYTLPDVAEFLPLLERKRAGRGVLRMQGGLWME